MKNDSEKVKAIKRKEQHIKHIHIENSYVIKIQATCQKLKMFRTMGVIRNIA